MIDVLDNLKTKINKRYLGKHIGKELYNEHIESEIKKIDDTLIPHKRTLEINKIKNKANADYADFIRRGEDIARKNRTHDLSIFGTASVITQVPKFNTKSEVSPISKNVQIGLNDVVNK